MRGERTKEKGSLGELRIMYEAAKRGYVVLTPCGDYSKYDLVVERNGKFERIQVKSVTPRNGVIEVHTKSMGFDNSQDTNNRSRQIKYQTGDFEWLAVYDLTNHNVYFLPSSMVTNRALVTLRLDPPQRPNPSVKMAKDYTAW